MSSTAIRLLADGSLVVILLIGVTTLLWDIRPPQWLKAFPVIIMAGLTSLFIGKVASILYQPTVARPFMESGVTAGAAYIDNPGFPSDHALLATVVALAVFFITRHKKFAYVLGILVLIMSVARVLALVHTPLDVVAGVAAGTIGALWYGTVKRLRT